MKELCPHILSLLRATQEKMPLHTKVTAVLLLLATFSLGALARELRGAGDREADGGRRLAVPKGSNCNPVRRSQPLVVFAR
jgi:hypothetical protein